MAITTKKMRLRTSKRNNKPKTSKRNNNKSYTKKRNSAIKGKKNSRRVKKQKGGVINDDDAKLLLKKLMNDYDEDYLQGTVFELDILLLLQIIMTYIRPDFYRLTEDKEILNEYETNKENVNKILYMFINAILENKKNIIRWELKISVDNESNSNAFNYYNNGKIMAGTQYINDFLFNIIIQNLLNNKINFELYINNASIPFTQPLNIEEIRESMNKMPDDFHFKTLLEKKLKELDIIGFGFGDSLSHNNANVASPPPRNE
jgi:hypothetical protein